MEDLIQKFNPLSENIEAKNKYVEFTDNLRKVNFDEIVRVVAYLEDFHDEDGYCIAHVSVRDFVTKRSASKFYSGDDECQILDKAIAGSYTKEKKKDEIPSENEFDLMTIEEALKLPQDILDYPEDGNEFWLKDKGLRGDTVAAYIDGNVDKIGASPFGYMGIRPIVRLSEKTLKSMKREGEMVIWGKKLKVLDAKWFDVTKYLGYPAILLATINEEGIFDKKSTVFEKSTIKKELKKMQEEMKCNI